MDLTERTVESRAMFEGVIVTLKVDQARLPDGKPAAGSGRSSRRGGRARPG